MQYLYAYWLVGHYVLYGSNACKNVPYAGLKIAVYREIFGPFYFCPFPPWSVGFIIVEQNKQTCLGKFKTSMVK